MNLSNAMALAAHLTWPDIKPDVIHIKKVGEMWYLGVVRWDRIFVREFATHRLALSTALWMIEVDGRMP